MKIDVLLVQPHQGESVKRRIFHPGIEIPLNIACLAAYLDRQGISNSILDMRLYADRDPFRQVENAVSNGKPSIVGISAFTSEADNARRVAELVKRMDENIVTVVGGHHASALQADLLREVPGYDLLVYGEGEITLTQIVDRTKSGGSFCDLDGVVYRNGDQVVVNPPRKVIDRLDDLPFAARDKLDLDRYVPSPGTGNYMRLPTTGIMASRGCPYRCNYCSKGVWGNDVRFRSVENVLSEVESCIDKYGMHDFRFYDDGLTLPQWDLKLFCNEILRRGIDISWNCYSRVNHVDKEKLLLMKKAGCYHIKFGIEFGTEKALRLADKGATLKQARKAVLLTKEAGIECKGNFMFGIPGETIDDCKQTIAFAIELSPDLATFYPFDLFPGSTFYRRKTEGDVSVDNRLPRTVTDALSSKAYVAFYFRVEYVLQRFQRLLRNPLREIVLVRNGLRMIGRFFFNKWVEGFGKRRASGR